MQEKTYLAGGCFWGVEYYLEKIPGVISTRVGFMGGAKESPSYEEVCTTDTGHAEAVEVVFDSSQTSFEEIAKTFFEIHDPTQMNRQGPDIGEQYRSEVFYTTDEQKAVTEKLINILKDKGLDVVTRVTEAGEFYVAEDYHQKYYDNNGHQPYCHKRVERF